ncbi:MAG: glycosyltransferase family 4 protein [Anaerolineales bacterium]
MEQDRGSVDYRQDHAPRLLFVANVSFSFIHNRLVLAQAAQAGGYEVHVATRVWRPEDSERIQQTGIQLHPIEIGRGDSGLLYDLRSVWYLHRLYRRLRPDLVHHVAMKPIVFGGLVARFSGIKSVVQAFTGLGYAFISGTVVSALRRKLVILALRVGCRRAGTIAILQNQADIEELVTERVIPREQTVLIRGSGVAVDEIDVRPEPAGVVRVVLPGRMLREKGVEEFVGAAEQLRADGVSAEFLLAGDTDPSNPGSLSLERLNDWTRSGVVKYLGFVQDIPDLFSSCHIICLPSYREGLSKSLVEAAACGRAIVTTDRPGCRDVVQDGVNGLLVPARDVPSLAMALKSLIDNANLRQQFGAAGRELAASKFDLNIVVEQTLEVYEKLLRRTTLGRTEAS